MKKIPTLFLRDADDRAHVTDQVSPGCEWVLAGDGVPTRKWDGTCMLLDDRGQWWSRREVKPNKPAPAGFVEEDYDPVTGKTVGWEPAEQSGFAKFHQEALDNGDTFYPATYELCGPKINGNPQDLPEHQLISHSTAETLTLVTPTLTAERAFELIIGVGAQGWEGIVWHHPDGRMAKLKVRDLVRSQW